MRSFETCSRGCGGKVDNTTTNYDNSYKNYWTNLLKQGKSERFDKCHRTDNLAQIVDPNRRVLGRCDLEIWPMTLKKKSNEAPL